MKNLIVLVITIVIAMNVNVIAQNVNVTVSGDAQIASMNVSLPTGSVFESATSFIVHANVGVSHERFGLTAYYNGHVSLNGSQTKFTLVDVMGSYKINDDLTVHFGPELEYTDYLTEDDKIGGCLIAMATWSRGRLSTTGIIFTNIQFTDIHVIGSANYQITDKLSGYVLGAYTNKNAGPFYWLAGMKINPLKHISVGAYYIHQTTLKGFMANIVLAF